jgi:hypothetical protein
MVFRGSRFQKLFLYILAALVCVPVLIFVVQRYEEDSVAYLKYSYCQQVALLQDQAKQLKLFSTDLNNNVYLEETFDQKVLPNMKTYFITQMKPQVQGRVLSKQSVRAELDQDIQAIESVTSIQMLISALEKKSFECKKIGNFQPRLISASYLTNYFKIPPDQFPLKAQEWQSEFAKLKPLAEQVKKQIQNDFGTLCQGWKNSNQAQQISRYFQNQCDNPKTKKKCSAEQNVKLKAFAHVSSAQFEENFFKFKKKWIKISLALTDMEKRCL